MPDGTTPIPPVSNPVVPPENIMPGFAMVSASPVGPASSAPDAYPPSGPPYLTSMQGLEISYKRVPVGQLSSVDITLSSNAIKYTNIGSFLVATVYAYFTASKDWATYSTSSSQQPQTFEFKSTSSDEYGRSYGPITASDIGPGGTILTKQPFGLRIPWNDASGHEEVHRVIKGSTAFAVRNPTSETSSTVNPNDHTDNKRMWIPFYDAGALVSDGDVRVVDDSRSYYIHGGYGTSQENLWQIFALIDQIGLKVTNSDLYSIPANVVSRTPVRDLGFSEYQIGRHNYNP